jgi:hypothetical protein
MRLAGLSVMAGLALAIHALPRSLNNVDARVKPGHDDRECGAPSSQ